MNIEHDTAPCTPSGHSRFIGYSARIGKLRSLHGRVVPCPACAARFGTDEARDQHVRAKHTGEGA